MGLTWKETEAAVLNGEEWRGSVVQCVHMDRGRALNVGQGQRSR